MFFILRLFGYICLLLHNIFILKEDNFAMPRFDFMTYSCISSTLISQVHNQTQLILALCLRSSEASMILNHSILELKRPS